MVVKQLLPEMTSNTPLHKQKKLQTNGIVHCPQSCGGLMFQINKLTESLHATKNFRQLEENVSFYSTIPATFDKHQSAA